MNLSDKGLLESGFEDELCNRLIQCINQTFSKGGLSLDNQTLIGQSEDV